MIIKCTKGVELGIFASDTATDAEVTLTVSVPGSEPVIVSMTTNHAQAFEHGVVGARLEAEARGRGT